MFQNFAKFTSFYLPNCLSVLRYSVLNVKPAVTYESFDKFRKKFIRKMAKNLLGNTKNVYVSILKGSKKTKPFLTVTFFFEFPSQTDGEKPELRKLTFNRDLDAVLSATYQRMSINMNNLMTKSSTLSKKNKKAKLDNVEIGQNFFPVDMFSIKTKTGEIIDVTKQNEEAFSTGITFHIGDKVYDISYKIPYLEKFKVDQRLMVGFPIVPSVNIVDGNVEDSLFFWHVEDKRGDVKNNTVDHFTPEDTLQHVEGFSLKCSEYYFVPSFEDVGKRLCLTCLPKRENITGLPMVYLSTRIIEDIVNGEEMIWSERHQLCAEKSPSDTLRVVDYNILANLYLELDKIQDELYFPYCPVQFQEFEYRYPLMLTEILGYNADLICLQEVEQKFWRRFGQPFFERNGYAGLFTIKGQQVNEGSATFYRPEKLKFIESADVVISDLLKEDEHSVYSDLIAVCKQSQQIFDFFTSRPAILQVSLFSSVLDEKVKIVVCSTHFHFKPKHGYVRMFQAAFCLRYIQSYVEKLKQANGNSKFGVLFCGDFNTIPTETTYRLMTNGYVSADDPEWLTGKADYSEFKGIDLQTPLRLKSACCPVEYTNFTGPHFQGCLDYIFYTEDVLKVQKVVPMPRHELVTKYIGIPSKICPSDHLPLICEFKFV